MDEVVDTDEDIDIVEELVFWADLIDASKNKARLIFLDSSFLRVAAEEIVELRDIMEKSISLINAHKASDHDTPIWYDKRQELLKYYQSIQERFKH